MPNRKVAINGKTSGRQTPPGVPPLPPDLCFTIEETTPDGERLDLLLSRRHPDFSRSQYKRLILKASVRINQQPVKPSYTPVVGDRVEVWLPRLEATEQLAPESMPLDILYEDEAIIVVNKPPGLVVHPGAGHFDGTLVHGLLAHSPKLAIQGSPLRPGIVHRLDQDTSGAMVVAKTERAYLNLIEQFKRHTISKQYLALVYGNFDRKLGTISARIGRHPKNRKKMAVLPAGREAVSHWQVEEGFGVLGLSLVRVTIETGRTHQIRVHMSHIGHPVVGDATYGGGKVRARSLTSKPIRSLLSHVERQLLHAHRLGIEHPENGRPMIFEAPLPTDFETVLGVIRSRPTASS
jgi:23S rRNA pseudouridine1911/1915/1917 synthase